MVQVDLYDFLIKCDNCGHEETLDHFSLPKKIECCDEPKLALVDEVELDIQEI